MKKVAPIGFWKDPPWTGENAYFSGIIIVVVGGVVVVWKASNWMTFFFSLFFIGDCCCCCYGCCCLVAVLHKIIRGKSSSIDFFRKTWRFLYFFKKTFLVFLILYELNNNYEVEGLDVHLFGFAFFANALHIKHNHRPFIRKRDGWEAFGLFVKKLYIYLGLLHYSIIVV